MDYSNALEYYQQTFDYVSDTDYHHIATALADMARVNYKQKNYNESFCLSERVAKICREHSLSVQIFLQTIHQ